VNGLQLCLLGRKLMKIGEEALPGAGFHQLPASVRLVLLDVFEHPNSSVREITARVGFPESHVSAAVARLRDGGAVETAADPQDRRRTLVRPSPEVRQQAAHHSADPIDGALAAALGTDDPTEIGPAVAAIEELARRLTLGALHRLPRTAEFDAMYATTPPWDIGRPQPAFVALAESGVLRGRVLDAGCGTGEHALLAASLGLPATGIDTAPAAIAIAQRKARERNLAARFLVSNALELGALGEQFDTVLDCGLFHVFDDDERLRYVDQLRAVIPAGGRYLMLCFSDRQPGALGPRRVTQDEIRASFADGWRIDAIEPAALDITIVPGAVQSWRVSATRVR
jgi:SAM-dependent methyltransferase